MEKLNLKGIYAVLSRIWKCRKSRAFGANFLGQKLVGANFTRFCKYAPAPPELEVGFELRLQLLQWECQSLIGRIPTSQDQPQPECRQQKDKMTTIREDPS